MICMHAYMWDKSNDISICNLKEFECICPPNLDIKSKKQKKHKPLEKIHTKPGSMGGGVPCISIYIYMLRPPLVPRFCLISARRL